MQHYQMYIEQYAYLQNSSRCWTDPWMNIFPGIANVLQQDNRLHDGPKKTGPLSFTACNFRTIDRIGTKFGKFIFQSCF